MLPHLDCRRSLYRFCIFIKQNFDSNAVINYLLRFNISCNMCIFSFLFGSVFTSWCLKLNQPGDRNGEPKGMNLAFNMNEFLK
ncbi:hypothetical protein Scep_020151 [Stephania cephalantha]|uniref:Uncharacterized protein n=1 Tax=Stephania cephalantha TaxID=152367 RepID=A0AAP0ICC9_9MAGN